jgi:hypothetical protein
MHVGLVGTGNMGRPMAKNILKAGHQAKTSMGREAWSLYGQALGRRAWASSTSRGFWDSRSPSRERYRPSLISRLRRWR